MSLVAAQALTGTAWIRTQTKRRISSFGSQVAELLKDAFGDLCVLEQLAGVDWSSTDRIEVAFFRSLSTNDGYLTRLVLLSHARQISLQISPRSGYALNLRFSNQPNMHGDMPAPLTQIAEDIEVME